MTARIAVIGRSGQVSQALMRRAAAIGCGAVAAGRPDLNTADLDSVGQFLVAARPQVVVNAAAYTAVDQAEREQEAAFAANVRGPALLATLCNHFGLPLIHLSTDYVFDGTASRPYVEDSRVNPLGVYGATKAAGEAAIRSALPRHIILRTAWVYSADGANFVKTMLRLADERDVVRVVADQRGSPTYADDLASAILGLAERLAGRAEDVPWGTYHLTGAGETTWHGFAAEIFRLAGEHGHRVPRLEAITTAEYPRPARRPAYSVLNTDKAARNLFLRLPPWEAGLPRCVAALLTSRTQGVRS